ncbi:MAG: hypothetical protein CVU92_04235 [Firmicutes bacterium HGW-Firmicutes-17]|nr:MAG: hypothetical protein CVU92_04235 [Firmicutes bacterium HGW-Firmicutes-17]
MTRYCRNCGKALDGECKFCVHCGAKIIAAEDLEQSQSPIAQDENVCSFCGNPLRDNLKFCTACGNPVSSRKIDTAERAGINPAFNQKKDAIFGIIATLPAGNAAQIIPSAAMATDWSGEMVLQSGMDLFGNARILAAVPGMTQTLKGGIKGLGSGLKETITHPIKLVPALVLAMFWLLQLLLPSLGVSIPFGGFWGWLTFARGGLTGGVAGMIGGMLGKGVFAGMLTALLLPLFSGKNPISSGRTGIRRWIDALRPKDLAGVSLLLLGWGMGLIANRFLTGTNSLQNSMLGIVMTLSLLRIIGSQSGFVTNLAAALVKQTLGNRLSEGLLPAANRLIAGMAAGTALGVLLSPLPITWLDYALGGLLALIGLVLLILESQQKEGQRS